MTSRFAVVILSSERGPSSHDDIDEDGWAIVDTSPDHTAYILEGVNCSAKEFTDWFSVTDVDANFAIGGKDSNELLDLGGSNIKLAVGMQLEVTFDNYFDALIEAHIRFANSQLDKLINDARQRLGNQISQNI